MKYLYIIVSLMWGWIFVKFAFLNTQLSDITAGGALFFTTLTFLKYAIDEIEKEKGKD